MSLKLELISFVAADVELSKVSCGQLTVKLYVWFLFLLFFFKIQFARVSKKKNVNVTFWKKRRAAQINVNL